MRWLAAWMVVFVASGCADPYAGWPEPGTYFPYVHTPERGLEDYLLVRFETETWDPEIDTEITAGYVQKALYHKPGGAVETLDHFGIMRSKMPPPGSGLRLSFVGDVLPPGGDWTTFAQPAAHLLDGDLRAGNLETPTSPHHPTDRSEMGLYQLNSPVEMLDGLPLDVLQLNNNHCMDFDDEALEATLVEVQQRGYASTGIDTHADVEVRGKRVAFLSFTWGINRRELTSTHDLFVVPFGHIGERIDLEPMLGRIRTARNAADLVVVMLHWGFEYEYYPEPHFLIIAREIVAAGADLIVGQGPHVVQPAEICHVNRPEEIPGIGTCSVRDGSGRPRTAAVLYSLANYSTHQYTVPCRSGIVATVSLDAGVTGLGWEPTIMLKDPTLRVEPLADNLDDPDLAGEMDRLDAHLGTGWKR